MTPAFHAFSAEVLKLVTLPVLGLVTVLTWAATGLLRLADPPGGVLGIAQAGFLVLGALAAGQEYHGGGQIRASLLTVPRRPLLVVVKFAAIAVTAAPAVLVGAALAGEPRGAGRLLLGLLLAAGVGTVLRHPVGAVGTLLIAYGTGKPLIFPLLPELVLDVPLWGWTTMIVLVAGVVFNHREA
ncbi:hypothetical protein [Actinoplanes couchii]|uniref:Uncharacterized protein n=1 Tax=Actinoplanes couchii TaxID=403638 RepID=A0ABQ3XFM3_9ACTN|nr:hypothetical protein [Actinoplanes couchii]MDR6321752.1 hypothetical protein [Actinoplanes couchii]GID57291.1 hypothetical protein Aco03nite_056950 [Actinoplanes couchii]